MRSEASILTIGEAMLREKLEQQKTNHPGVPADLTSVQTMAMLSIAGSLEDIEGTLQRIYTVLEVTSRR